MRPDICCNPLTVCSHQLLLPLCMININQIPSHNKSLSLTSSLFSCEILSTSLSLPPSPCSQCLSQIYYLPPLRLSVSLAQSLTHLSYFSFSPTLFTYDLLELRLQLIPPQLAKQELCLVTIQCRGGMIVFLSSVLLQLTLLRNIINFGTKPGHSAVFSSKAKASFKWKKL